MALYGRWQTKPPPGTQIDWTHPLTRGLVGCWPMNEGCGTIVHNMAPSRKVNHGAIVNGATWVPSRGGGGISTVTGSSHYIECGNIAELSGAGQATLFIVAANLNTFQGGQLTSSTANFGFVAKWAYVSLGSNFAYPASPTPPTTWGRIHHGFG